ncbi:MAG: hypothetical protein KF857_03015 [Fimbriimonadaceae bacterium]|nr:hypothetical protein [Fimbriimonadaceae bacterium]
MKNWKNFAGAAVLGAVSTIANAQWDGECIDPANTAPFSTPYVIDGLISRLAGVTVGITGTATYGGTAGPCYNPAVTMQTGGSWAFGAGTDGSVQTDFDDNNFAYTMGYIGEPVGDFTYGSVVVSVGGTEAIAPVGRSGYRTSYQGASKRYGVVIWDGTVNGVAVEVEVEYRLIADAIRMRWRCHNQSTSAADIGLMWGMSPAMHGATRPDATGNIIANSPFGGKLIDGYTGFNMLPIGKPLRTEKKYFLTNPNYPANIKTLFGQEDNVGMRIDNVPGDGITDADSTDMFIFANRGNILTVGDDNNKTMRTNLFGDSTGLLLENDIAVGDPAILQRFPVKSVGPGTYRDIVHYIRSNWSQGFYLDPYSMVIDAPATINWQSDQTGDTHAPNPFTIGAWVDNQYADIDKSITLTNVTLTLELPKGMSFDPSDPQFASVTTNPATGNWVLVKSLTRIDPNELGNLTWRVRTDGVTYGDLPVKLTASTTPGPTRTITKTIKVAASPTYTFTPGANLVTIPYRLGDSSLDATLGLLTGRDYIAYSWDPEVRGYVPTTTSRRGFGFWLLPMGTNLGQITLNNAQFQPDSDTGGLLISLSKGWNLIGNPYNYPIRLGQIVGVAEDTPESALTWAQLVQNGFVNSSLSYWQPDTALPDGGSYQFIGGTDAEMQPHVGYWVFVNTYSAVRLQFPPVYQEQLITTARSNNGSTAWRNTDRQWRLQLSARSMRGFDASNYIGVTTDKKKADGLEIPKPPMAPNSKLEMAIVDPNAKSTSRLAQSFTDRVAKKVWQVEVHAKEAGDVTVTWPNVASLPRNVRFRLTDAVSGQKFDLRSTSGYTFKMAQPGTRQLTISMEPGGSVRPVIGDVNITRSGRDVSGPVTISYSLSADALVSVRILAANGKEVYTVSRGRADGTGQNSVTWMLKDSANRSVAPGTYKVEILAETPTGERVRKIVPVNVIR